MNFPRHQSYQPLKSGKQHINLKIIPDWCFYLEASLQGLLIPFATPDEFIFSWLEQNHPTTVSADIFALILAINYIPPNQNTIQLINDPAALAPLRSLHPNCEDYVLLKWAYYFSGPSSNKDFRDNENFCKWLQLSISELTTAASVRNLSTADVSRVKLIESIITYDNSYVSPSGVRITKSILEEKFRELTDTIDIGRQVFSMGSIITSISIWFYQSSLYLFAINLGFNFSPGSDYIDFVLQHFPTRDWFDRQADYISKLPAQILQTIGNYTDYNYSHINNQFREGNLNHDVLDMQEAVLQAPLNTLPYTVFRRVKDIKYVKDIFKNSGFLSTSFDYADVIRRSTESGSDQSRDFILQITVAPNTPALYIEGSSEKEILFPHNCTLQVTHQGYVTYYGKGGFYKLRTVRFNLYHEP